MKKLLFIACIMACTFPITAQHLSIPQPSPTQTLIQNFGIGTIELSYSRPGLKGRSIGGDFVPFGTVWRTGANGATTITFSNDVTINEKNIPAGKYGLLSIPGKDQWIVIVTKDLTVNNPSKYNKANDVVRVKIPVKMVTEKVETFTINFSHLTRNTCILDMTWEHAHIELPVSTNTDALISDEIETIFKEDHKPYYAAAQFYYDTDKDIEKAKEWINKASEDPKNAHLLHIWLLKARIYKKAGDKPGAQKAAQQTIAIAREVKNEEYVQLAQNLIDAL